MKYGEKIYYLNESDEIVKYNTKTIKVDENYKYDNKNPIYKFFSWLTYRFIAIPYAFITFKFIKNVKFHNIKALKSHIKGGYFIYANHTNQFADGFCPALICFPKKPHIIVNPVNISIPFIGKLTQMWGTIPIPENFEATKNFYKAIKNALNHNNPILIYPEAQLWPYHTKIRNFSSVSFRYPVKFNKPVFTFTTIYKLKHRGKKPKVEIYVDGPFYANTMLSEKEQQQQLRDIVFIKLVERAHLSNYEYVKYIKKEKMDD